MILEPRTSNLSRLIVLGFVAWAAAFIYRSSFIAIDHHRYFSLFDDAMISMRYAWNFSHGRGLVWNAGEHVQGYTNLLMTLLMSVATGIWDRAGAVLAVQTVGVALMLSVASVTARIAEQLEIEAAGSRGVVGAAVVLAVLGYYPLVFWSLMGMETGLLALLVTSGVLGAFTFERSDKTIHALFSSAAFGLAVLTRSDAIVFAGLTWGYLAWLALADRRPRALGRLALFAAVVGVCVAGQTIFQYAYYGEALPNTYTLKLTGMPLADRLRNGAAFMWPFVKESSVILALATISVISLRRRQLLFLLSLLVAGMAYQTFVGGDPWNYWRIMAPCMPMIFVLVVAAVNRAAVRLVPARRNVAVVVGIAIVLLSCSIRFLPEVGLLRKPLQAANARENVNTALVLERVTTAHATVAVLFAGSIPYYLDRRAIDLLGKSDRYIAHLPADLSGAISWFGMTSVPGHNKYDLDYSVKRLQPTYTQTLQWGHDDVTVWAATHYVRVEQDGIGLWLLRDSPDVRWEMLSVRRHEE